MNPTDENHSQSQLPLFDMEPTPSEPDAPPPQSPAPQPVLDAEDSLNVALGVFETHMKSRHFTQNTQQAFRLDIELLIDYLGPGVSLGQIGTAKLRAFLTWMQEDRGVPCSPKTLERRITTLKVFFGWLVEEDVLPRDPAAPLIHQAVSAPLPDVLDDEEVKAVLGATQALRHGDGEEDPDPRPHLLVTLILHTGIKKGECVRITLNHLDLTNAERPALWVRYNRPSRRHKERRILLPPWWPRVLAEYQQVYEPKQFLFPWTARNLEYVLGKVAERADVSRLTFEMLRWTCAVRDYVEGVEPEALRQKLGLSEISWYEVESKLTLLAQQLGYTLPNTPNA